MHARITLLFGRHDFEYDIYSLLKAFWPQADITSGYLDENEETFYGQDKGAVKTEESDPDAIEPDEDR